MSKQWYKIENKADKAEIWIYEEIGEDWFTGGGITSKEFQKELAEIKSSQIDLHINSPGGSVQDGMAIYNLIKQHPATVTTYIDGWAASIASIIALAGDRVIMAENGLFMIHEPFGNIYGATAGTMRARADLLDKVTSSLVGTYMNKTGLPESDIMNLMKGPVDDKDNIGTWLSADEALAFGFIDEIAGRLDMAACAKFIPIMAKAGFKHIPENIPAKSIKPTAKDAEKALRDVGFSHKQAKVILSEGIKDFQRDVDDPPAPRDVVPIATQKKDRVSDLLTRAEIAAPSQNRQGGNR